MDFDRMAIEEVGRRPEAMAAEIHRQLGSSSRAVDVHAIALKLDILEIRAEPLTNIEGALLTQPERTNGIILCNGNSHRRRQRFTIAHELLHFLNDTHVQTDAGFACRADDFRNPFDRPSLGATRHVRQEAEANRFAIDLLAPAAQVERLSSDSADLAEVLALAGELNLSREAAARRYVELHPGEIAIGFIRAGRLRYWARSPDCPPLVVRRGQQMPSMPSLPNSAVLSGIEVVDPDDWLTDPSSAGVSVQVLRQQDDHAMLMIAIAAPDANGENGDLLDRPPNFR